MRRLDKTEISKLFKISISSISILLSINFNFSVRDGWKFIDKAFYSGVLH
jgi:hypothetical protein